MELLTILMIIGPLSVPAGIIGYALVKGNESAKAQQREIDRRNRDGHIRQLEEELGFIEKSNTAPMIPVKLTRKC